MWWKVGQGENILSKCGGKQGEEKAYLVDTKSRRKHTQKMCWRVGRGESILSRCGGK